MRATTWILLGLALAFAGLGLFVGFMVVFDELFNLAIYCGLKCLYPFPWSVPLDLWTAWVWVFSAICIGVGLLIIGVAIIVMAVIQLRRLEKKNEVA